MYICNAMDPHTKMCCTLRKEHPGAHRHAGMEYVFIEWSDPTPMVSKRDALAQLLYTRMHSFSHITPWTQLPLFMQNKWRDEAVVILEFLK